jgi:ABC-type multidrug transport system permease subunit
LPLSTTLPIFIGGAIRGIIDNKHKSKDANEEEDLRKGNLFATGLVAGGAIAGVIVAFLSANETIAAKLNLLNMEHAITAVLGEQGYYLLGTLFFFVMAFILYRIASKPEDNALE